MGEQRAQHLYEFGPFCLDTRERVLLRDGRPLQLKPKVYETLLALIGQSGHVVDKEELMKRVWPDVVVEENNLTGNIFALRRAFGEHQYIETVPRRGYRFTADVKQVMIEDIKITGRAGAETEVLIKETISTTRKAIDSHLKGRYHLNKRTASGLRKAIDHFREAIEFDPTYALAYAGLADSYTLLGSAGYDAHRPLEMMPRAKAAAVRALEIDEGLAEAHTSLAFIKFRLDWDWAGAEKEFARAIELNPGAATSHHWYALYLTAMDRQTEAISEIKRAHELDPLSLIIASAVGRIYHHARKYDQALEEYRKALDMDANYGETHLNLGMTYEQKGMYDAAIAEFQEAFKLSECRPVMLAVLGHVYSMAGKLAEARGVLEQLEELSKRSFVSPLDMAIVYTGLGEKEHAIECFEQAYQERSGLMVFLKVDPLYDSLRSQPRFNDLLRRMNLTP